MTFIWPVPLRDGALAVHCAQSSTGALVLVLALALCIGGGVVLAALMLTREKQ